MAYRNDAFNLPGQAPNGASVGGGAPSPSATGQNPSASSQRTTQRTSAGPSSSAAGGQVQQPLQLSVQSASSPSGLGSGTVARNKNPAAFSPSSNSVALPAEEPDLSPLEQAIINDTARSARETIGVGERQNVGRC
jgi:hypothetical protein